MGSAISDTTWPCKHFDLKEANPDPRPFTKEEAKVHAKIVDSMGTVVEENVLDLGGELDG